ncbi:hypothetical protein J4438_03305 [Candidatus Woesearchaeota archaeon]|nr:hypothetical protein [Candidatus Woesearchaeota archaeon]
MALEYKLKIVPENSYEDLVSRMKRFNRTPIIINDSCYVMLEQTKGGMELEIVHQELIELTRERGVEEIASGRFRTFGTHIRIG